MKVKQYSEIDKYLETDQPYDMILGHGLIDQMQFFVQESENSPTKTYVYDTDKLVMASKGPVLFGHIHQYQSYQRKFYYVGPFTMLERGGTDAGFVVVGISTRDRGKYEVEHYINPDSAAYYDITVTEKMLDDIPISEIMRGIDSIVAEAKTNDLFTLRITRGDAIGGADRVASLESRYRSDKRFSIIKKIKTKKDIERDKAQEERKQKYSYLLDQNVDMADILYTYYINDVKPMYEPDQPSAKLVKEDFRKALLVKKD